MSRLNKIKKWPFSTSFSLLLIPQGDGEIKKFYILKKHMSLAFAAALSLAIVFMGSISGFFYYKSTYSALKSDQEKLRVYEKERGELLDRVANLERTLGKTEEMTGKLASMVGSEKVSMQRGVGPIPPADFDIKSKTRSLDLTELSPKLDSLENRALTLQEKVKNIYKLQEDKLAYIASTPSIWPVKGWVTSEFGYRKSPFNFSSDFHAGIDIAAQWGTPIFAPADGVVTFAGTKNGYGKMVIIDHGFGITTHFGHTSELLVQEGQKITRGSKIALVGSTGHSTGPHLHYEVHMDGVAVDPMKYGLQ